MDKKKLSLTKRQQADPNLVELGAKGGKSTSKGKAASRDFDRQNMSSESLGNKGHDKAMRSVVRNERHDMKPEWKMQR